MACQMLHTSAGGLITLVPGVYVSGLHSAPVSQSYAFLSSSLPLSGGCQTREPGFTTPTLLQPFTTSPLHQLTNNFYNTPLHQLPCQQLTDSSYNTSAGVLQVCEDKVKVKDEEAGKDEEMEPVYDKYCRVCGVSMNAQAQAKQHYEGRSHARRLKMYVLGSHTDDVTPKEGQAGVSKMSPVTSNVTRQSDIDPDIYCKVCIVSFNSAKQARQHYRGKAHARRVKSVVRRREKRDRHNTCQPALYSVPTISEPLPLHYLTVEQAYYLNSPLLR